VLAAAGIGGGGAAAASIGGGGALGLAGSSLVAKIALVGVMAGGGITAEKLLVEDPGAPAQRPAAAQEPRDGAGDGVERARERKPVPAATRERPPAVRAGETKPDKASNGASSRGAPAAGVAAPRRGAGGGRGGELGHEKQARVKERGKPAEPPRGERAQGRGRVVKPALPGPVKRGPAELPAPAAPKPHPAPGPKAVAPSQEAKAPPPEPAAAQPTVPPNVKEKAAKE
jgi:hypothetical protein